MASSHHDHHSHHDEHVHHHVGHHSHHHHTNANLKVLIAAFIITFLFGVVEALSGVWAGSLALISDAGHMVSDALALAMAAAAAWIAKHPPSSRHSYGLIRAEVIAASLNGLLMLGVIAWIAYEAFKRLHNPQSVSGNLVMMIAGIGLIVNLFVARILSHGENDLNRRAAFLHVLGDILGSIAALIAGIVIYFTGWMDIDPLLSLFVAGLLLVSTINLLRNALSVLMEAVPANIPLEKVGKSIAKIEGIINVHDLHIWALSSGKTALSAHIALANMNVWPILLKQIQTMLKKDFQIDHVTIQPEVVPLNSIPSGKIIPIHEQHSHHH